MVLQKLTRPSVVEPSAHLLGRLDDRGESDVRARIEVEDEAAGHFRLARAAIPGMQLERRDLRDRRQALDAVDLEIGLAGRRRR